MPFLMLKELPPFECLLAAAQRYPSLEPAACDSFLNLLMTGDRVAAAEGRFLAGRGLGRGRFHVLMLLNRGVAAPATPAGLAEASAVTRATMTGLLDTLEKDLLVERQTQEHDRRMVLIRLTEKGRSLIEGVLPDYFRYVAEVMSPLAEAEQNALVDLLQKIQARLGVSEPALATAV